MNARPQQTFAPAPVTARTWPRRPDAFSRALTADDEQSLLREWLPKLRLVRDISHVRYLAYRIAHIEAVCAGRLAGDLADAVLRCLALQAAPGPKLNLLEIGTLFGVNAVAMYDVALSYFEQVSLTLIDPLDGYYGRGTLDPATGLLVSERLLRRNLALNSVPSQDVRIVAARSDAPEALHAVEDQQYGLAFIDGDHSYEGARLDCKRFLPHVMPDGIVVFDNYRDGTSPGVDRLVDELKLDPRLGFVAAGWRTAIFQKRQEARFADAQA